MEDDLLLVVEIEKATTTGVMSSPDYGQLLQTDPVITRIGLKLW